MNSRIRWDTLVNDLAKTIESVENIVDYFWRSLRLES